MGGAAQFNQHHTTLSFPKTGEQIKERCLAKITNLEKRVKIREEVINGMLKEHGLNTLDVMELMKQEEDDEGIYSATYSNTRSSSDAPILSAKAALKAREWEAISGEHNRLKLEKDELTKLHLIANNIGLNETYKINFAELVYFEFK